MGYHRSSIFVMGPNLLGTVGSKRCKGMHPVIRDRQAKIVDHCKRERGGTKTVGAPEYKLTVTNYPDPNAT
jgi:hypothetical protein